MYFLSANSNYGDFLLGPLKRSDRAAHLLQTCFTGRRLMTLNLHFQSHINSNSGFWKLFRASLSVRLMFTRPSSHTLPSTVLNKYMCNLGDEYSRRRLSYVERRMPTLLGAFSSPFQKGSLTLPIPDDLPVGISDTRARNASTTF